MIATRILGIISVFTFISFLSACDDSQKQAESQQTPSASNEAAQTITKSPNDKREYASFTLDNQLKVVLISDPKTDKSAAALDVFVGSMSDPADRLGLTHFLEHMLFLGTEKYPEPGEYQNFIKTHGGSHNAYTSPEHTNYFFDIDNAQLEPALDRFSQFFIAPVLDEQFVEREKNAVHSEYEMRRKNEGRRIAAAKKTLFNDAHPYSQFSIGSLDTLADTEDSSTREKLIEFYNKHYSANIMSVVILSNQPIDALKKLAFEKFGSIKNKKAKSLSIENPLFADNTLPKKLRIEPLKDSRILTISFPVPPVHKHYKSKPHHYLGNLIGHEGPGSLLSTLKKRGWSDALSAGMGVNHEDFATFEVKVSLTEEGLNQTDNIITLLYQYIALVKDKGIQSWIFDEQKQIAKMHFEFQEQAPPISYVSTLARRLHLYPTEDILVAPYTMESFNSELTKSYLNKLSPENTLVTLVAKGVSTDQKESFFETDFSVADIKEDTLSGWQNAQPIEDFKLPEKNKFIPENLTLRSKGSVSETPSLIKNTESSLVWSKQDQDFLVPRADLYINLESNNSYTTPLEAVHTKLLAKQINEQLNEFGYPAYLAGLNYGITMTREGLLVSVSGYSDKQDVLLSEILNAIKQPNFDESKLAIFKDDLKRAWQNRSKDKPFEQTIREATQLLLNPFWTEQEQITALETVTVDSMQSFSQKFLSDLKLSMLCHGNITKEECLQLASSVDETLIVNAATHEGAPDRKLMRLTQAQHASRNIDIDHNDSAISYYLQSDNQSMENRALFSMLAHSIQPGFYSKLRTELQLGYAVFSSSMEYLRTPGISFILQSPVAEPSEILFHIDAYLSAFETNLKEMSDEEFEKQKEGLLTKVLEEHKNLKERSHAFWGQIMNRYYNFDAKKQLAEEIKAISKERFLAFYQNDILKPETGSLITYAVGNEQEQNFPTKPWEQTEISSHGQFKTNRESFSLKPFTL